MKIENPAALRFIMQDDIYLLPGDKNSPVEKIAEPVVKTEKPILNYLGKHKKSFLVIVHYTNHEFIADTHLAALENILKRKEYSLDDVAIFNKATHPGVGFEELQAYFNPQKLLVLGKDALPANSIAFTFNQPQELAGYTALYSFSFDEMMDNTANKKTFWDQMKNL